MELAVIVVVSLVPALLWVYYFYRKDRYEKEPPALLMRAFGAGVLAVFPAAAIEYPFRPLIVSPDHPLERLVVSFIVIGLGEEFFKYLAVRWSVLKENEFNEVLDSIIYFITAALGFAAFENLLYIMSFGLQIAPLRAVLTSLAHASFSGILGYYVGIARFFPNRNNRLALLTGFALAALFHGGYDYLLMSQTVSPLAALAMIGFFYLVLITRIQKAVGLSPFKS